MRTGEGWSTEGGMVRKKARGDPVRPSRPESNCTGRAEKLISGTSSSVRTPRTLAWQSVTARAPPPLCASGAHTAWVRDSSLFLAASLCAPHACLLGACEAPHTQLYSHTSGYIVGTVPRDCDIHKVLMIIHPAHTHCVGDSGGGFLYRHNVGSKLAIHRSCP